MVGKRKEKKLWTIIGIVLIIVLLLFTAMFAYVYIKIKKENVSSTTTWRFSALSATNVSCNDLYNIVTFAVITATDVKLDELEFQLVSENHITISLKMKEMFSLDEFTDEKLNNDPDYQVYFYDNATHHPTMINDNITNVTHNLTVVGMVDAGDWFKVKAPGDGKYEVKGIIYKHDIVWSRVVHF